jgi:hypothetical protein
MLTEKYASIVDKNRMLAKHNIKSVALPHRKIASYLPPFKEATGLEHRAFTASPVNAAVCILDRAAALFNSASRNIVDT